MINVLLFPPVLSYWSLTVSTSLKRLEVCQRWPLTFSRRGQCTATRFLCCWLATNRTLHLQGDAATFRKSLRKKCMYEDIVLIPKPSTKGKAWCLGTNINISLVPRLGLLWGVASHPECKSLGVCSVLCAIYRCVEYLPLVPKKRQKKKPFSQSEKWIRSAH